MLGISKRLFWQLLALTLVVLMLTITSPSTRAASNDSKVHGVQLASPAVVRIITLIAGQVILSTSEGKVVFPLDGSSYQGVMSGSGAFISSDGYVLTADHVVDQKNNPGVYSFFLTEAIQEYAKEADVPVDKATETFQWYIDNDRMSIPIEIKSQRVFLSTAYTGPLQNTAQITSYAVTRIVVNSPPDKQDVAIVKVEAHDLPYLTLASASSVHVQDSVTAVAYPADADTEASFADLLNPTSNDVNTINSLLTPSVETGQVTAQKTLSDGTEVYETTGISYYGSSGGPIINPQGQIVGFADRFTDSSQRVTMWVPGDIVAQYAKQAGIANPEKGAFMSLWTKAINEYDATNTGHWSQAYQDLKKLHDEYPQFGGVQTFLKEAQAKAATEQSVIQSQQGPNWLIIVLVGGGIIVVLGAAALLFVFMRRKKAAPYPQGPPPQSMPAPVPAGVWTEQKIMPPPQDRDVTLPLVKTCPAGHAVSDKEAHFCPVCGAPMESKTLQPQI